MVHHSPDAGSAGAERSEGSTPAGTAGGPLDLHEGIDDPRLADPRVGCPRWPEWLWLRSSQGEVVQGRCRATNLCPYCQRLYVMETVEMLALDALEYAPTIWVVLTAREHLTRAGCRRHLRQLLLALRRVHPDAEWFVQVEFQRRGALHLNLLIKGVDAEHVAQVRELLVARWCERVDALPVGQWAGVVADGGGVIRYLGKTLAHGLKREQAPPLGWRGHRTSQTRGYLVRPASVMRQEARRSRRLKAELARAIATGAGAHDAELVAHEAVAIADATTWALWWQPPVYQLASDAGTLGDRRAGLRRADHLLPAVQRQSGALPRAAPEATAAQRGSPPLPVSEGVTAPAGREDGPRRERVARPVRVCASAVQTVDQADELAPETVTAAARPPTSWPPPPLR